MALSESAINELLQAVDAGDGTDLIRDLVRWLVQELIEAEAAAAIGAGPLRTHWGAVDTPQRAPAKGLVDQSRRPAARHPEVPERIVLPRDPRTSPPDRPSPVCGGDGGLRQRRLDPIPSTTSS